MQRTIYNPFLLEIIDATIICKDNIKLTVSHIILAHSSFAVDLNNTHKLMLGNNSSRNVKVDRLGCILDLAFVLLELREVLDI